MIVAVTGSVGSGKSVVAKELAQLCQAECLDIDQFCREQLEKGNSGWKSVKMKWGKKFFGLDESIDRKALRKAIFNDPAIRVKLEGILHPLVKYHVLKLKSVHSAQSTLMVVEVPLLFEAGWQEEFDTIVTVSAENNVCRQRVMARDKVSLEDAQKILDAQLPIDQKIAKSDYVIDNSKDWDSTLVSITQLSRTLTDRLSSLKAQLIPENT